MDSATEPLHPPTAHFLFLLFSQVTPAPPLLSSALKWWPCFYRGKENGVMRGNAGSRHHRLITFKMVKSKQSSSWLFMIHVGLRHNLQPREIIQFHPKTEADRRQPARRPPLPLSRGQERRGSSPPETYPCLGFLLCDNKSPHVSGCQFCGSEVSPASLGCSQEPVGVWGRGWGGMGGPGLCPPHRPWEALLLALHSWRPPGLPVPPFTFQANGRSDHSLKQTKKIF